MLAVDFEGANGTTRKPDAMTDEQVAPMRVKWFLAKDEQGKEFPCGGSLWMPTKEDIEAIVAGKGIYMVQQAIEVNGKMFVSPTRLYTEKPF